MHVALCCVGACRQARQLLTNREVETLLEHRIAPPPPKNAMLDVLLS